MNTSRITTLTLVLVVAALIVSLSACDQLVSILTSDNDNVVDATTHVIDDLPIQKVSVAILESFPVQVNLKIEGYLADACTTLHETTERREGDTIHVQVTTKRPRDLACATVVSEIEHIVPLGTFASGMYKAIVNNVEVEFEVH